jgi:hypothetical protein
MNNGLTLGMWMMAAALVGIWLWQSGTLKKLWNMQITFWLFGLLVTFILVKSTGAYLYLAMGLGIMLVAKYFRSSIALLLLIIAISTYLSMGVSGGFGSGQLDQVVSFAAQISPERAQSLGFRFENEEILSAKARERILFGWGGFGRNRVFEETPSGELKDVSITDSFWIIYFGVYGVVGLASFFGIFLLPSLSFFLLKYPARLWLHPKVSSAAVLAVILTLYAVDSLLNAMYNPIYFLVSGGISGLVVTAPVISQNNKNKRRITQRRTNLNLKNL